MPFIMRVTKVMLMNVSYVYDDGGHNTGDWNRNHEDFLMLKCVIYVKKKTEKNPEQNDG